MKFKYLILTLLLFTFSNNGFSDNKKRKIKSVEQYVFPVDKEDTSTIIIKDLDGNIISGNNRIQTDSAFKTPTESYIILADSNSTEQTEIFDRTEVMPSFSGGEEKMMKYLNKNLQYPKVAKENGLEGTVVVKFTVEKNGSISNPVVLKDGAGGECSDEAIRLVKSMPKWNPGKQQGKPVRVYYKLPIKFNL